MALTRLLKMIKVLLLTVVCHCVLEENSASSMRVTINNLILILLVSTTHIVMLAHSLDFILSSYIVVKYPLHA